MREDGDHDGGVHRPAATSTLGIAPNVALLPLLGTKASTNRHHAF